METQRERERKSRRMQMLKTFKNYYCVLDTADSAFIPIENCARSAAAARL